jgi:hypothetical protein
VDLLGCSGFIGGDGFVLSWVCSLTSIVDINHCSSLRRLRFASGLFDGVSRLILDLILSRMIWLQ